MVFTQRFEYIVTDDPNNRGKFIGVRLDYRKSRNYPQKRYLYKNKTQRQIDYLMKKRIERDARN